MKSQEPKALSTVAKGRAIRDAIMKRAVKEARQSNRLQIIRLPRIVDESEAFETEFERLRAWLGDLRAEASFSPESKRILVVKLYPGDKTMMSTWHALIYVGITKWVEAVAIAVKANKLTTDLPTPTHRYTGVLLVDDMIYTSAFPLTNGIDTDEGHLTLIFTFREQVKI